MFWLIFFTCAGVILIDGKLWKMMASQEAHQKRVEALLREIRDKGG